MTTVSAPADPLVPRLEAIEKLIGHRTLQRAAQELNELVRIAPGDARVYLMGSRLAEAAGNLQASIDTARRAVGAAPGWSVALTELAMTGRALRLKEFVTLLHAALAGRKPLAVGADIPVPGRDFIGMRLASEIELSRLRRRHDEKQSGKCRSSPKILRHSRFRHLP